MTSRLRPLAAVVTVLAALVTALTPAAAQQRSARAPRRPPTAAVTRALETITEAGFRERLVALAHDSTRGRETPSPELERATAWVAAQFRAAGLRPAGDGDGYLQSFRLRQTRLDTLSSVSVAGGGQATRWMLGRDILFLGGATAALRDVPVVLMAGLPADTARPFGDGSVRGAAILLVVAPDQLRGPVLNPLFQHAQAEGAAAFVVLGEVPPGRWAQMVSRPLPQRWGLAESGAPAEERLGIYLAVRDSAAALLAAAGLERTGPVAPERQGIRPLAGFTLSATLHETTVDEPAVANVVGVLEGSDPALRGEAVVFTAHFDHVGVVGGRCAPTAAVPADSICNGADDNASGTVGIIELARAFAALRPRPARTLVFAAVTAEERGLLGAYHYTAHPVVPLERTVADLNLDMIARNPRDTVGLVGKDYTSLGGLVDRLVREHPELRLAPKEQPGMYPNSDHYAFAQRGVPALFFFSGVHDDLHSATDNVDRADTEQATRIVRLAFLVGLEVAGAAERPTWDPQARARLTSH